MKSFQLLCHIVVDGFWSIIHDSVASVSMNSVFLFSFSWWCRFGSLSCCSDLCSRDLVVQRGGVLLMIPPNKPYLFKLSKSIKEMFSDHLRVYLTHCKTYQGQRYFFMLEKVDWLISESHKVHSLELKAADSGVVRRIQRSANIWKQRWVRYGSFNI